MKLKIQNLEKADAGVKSLASGQASGEPSKELLRKIFEACSLSVEYSTKAIFHINRTTDTVDIDKNDGKRTNSVLIFVKNENAEPVCLLAAFKHQEEMSPSKVKIVRRFKSIGIMLPYKPVDRYILETKSSIDFGKGGQALFLSCRDNMITNANSELGKPNPKEEK